MSRVAEHQFLKGEENKVLSLIQLSIEKGDVVAEMGLGSRLLEVQERIKQIESSPDTLAEVSLLFDGAPVQGQRSIDAKFATRALSLFQDLVAKIFASYQESGLPGSRGQIPSREYSALRITGLATGSFGFTLEENGAEQGSILPTSAKEAMEEAINAIEALASADYQPYSTMLDRLNPRAVATATEFFSLLQASDAWVKTRTITRNVHVETEAVNRAVARLKATDINEYDVEWTGILLGITPLDRKFEFRREGQVAVISGVFGARISQDYLERIEREGLRLGATFRVRLSIKETKKPNGSVSVVYTAIDMDQASIDH